MAPTTYAPVVGRHAKDRTLRQRLAIRHGQDTHFYSMPWWWQMLVLLSATLTGLGVGQVQDRAIRGVLMLAAGLGVGLLGIWLRTKARKES